MLLIWYLNLVWSVAQSKFSQFLLRLLHDNHRSSVSEEHGLTSRDETSPEALDSLSLHDVPSASHRAVSNSFRLRLCKVLEHFQRPNYEEARTGSATRDDKLAHRALQQVRVLPGELNEAKVVRHHQSRPRVQFLESEEHLVELPSLACLPLDFDILKWALDEGTS